MLSSNDIIEALKNGLVIEPTTVEALQPASIDLKLSGKYIDYGNEFKLDKFLLNPQNFILSSTMERIELPNYLAAKVEGKSSTARLGLQVHLTAGWIDPGYKGNITLELFNVSNKPILLTTGMYICQICFFKLDTPTSMPYGSPQLKSKYQDSVGTVSYKE